MLVGLKIETLSYLILRVFPFYLKSSRGKVTTVFLEEGSRRREGILSGGVKELDFWSRELVSAEIVDVN